MTAAERRVTALTDRASATEAAIANGWQPPARPVDEIIADLRAARPQD